MLFSKCVPTWAAVATVLLASGIASAGPIATIYTGNNASFAGDANNPASAQGFTQLRDRWTADGLTVTITDVFNPEGCLWFATAPTSGFSASQVTALQSFLAGGGLIVLSHDGGGVTSQNGLLNSLGSSIDLFDFRSVGQQRAVVVDDSHPITDGLPNGTELYTFSPGFSTGGQALIDWPLGTNIVAVEAIGGGHVLTVSDFDMLNNVPHLIFPADLRPNTERFWDNIAEFACAQQEAVPEPASVVMLGLGLVGAAGYGVRRRKLAA